MSFVKCPKCGAERATVIYTSKDGTTAFIRCPNYHVHLGDEKNPDKEPKTGMVFTVPIEKEA